MINQIELAQLVDYIANALCFAPTRLLISQKNSSCGGSLIYHVSRLKHPGVGKVWLIMALRSLVTKDG
jgi:hypothetical protein